MHYTKFLLILTASSTGHSLRTDVQDKFYEMCETPKCEKDLYGHLQKSIPRNFKFSSSGCQSFNIPIDVPFPIHRCCDNMNVCFNSCGVRKESCDNDWRRCTEEMCLKETNEDLKLHCEITMGRIVDEILIPTKDCKKFNTAQKLACKCVDEAKFDKYHEKILARFYDKHAPEQSDKLVFYAKIANTVEKFGQLMYDLFLDNVDKKLIKYAEDATDPKDEEKNKEL